MTDMHAGDETELAFGGLRFGVAFRGPGATLRVDGEVDGHRRELLRFDDFIDAPHYHVPAEADPIMFDRDALGAPLDWYIDQIRDHLGELLRTGGYESIIDHVDLGEVTANADRIKQAMEDCVPEGYVRRPGIGLQRADG